MQRAEALQRTMRHLAIRERPRGHSRKRKSRLLLSVESPQPQLQVRHVHLPFRSLYQVIQISDSTSYPLSRTRYSKSNSPWERKTLGSDLRWWRVGTSEKYLLTPETIASLNQQDKPFAHHHETQTITCEQNVGFAGMGRWILCVLIQHRRHSAELSMKAKDEPGDVVRKRFRRRNCQ